MRTRWSTAIANLGFIVLAFLLILSDGAPEERSELAPGPPSEREAPSTTEPFGHDIDGEFRTDAAEPSVLWRKGGDVLYVQAKRLTYRSRDGAERLLYEWNAPLRAKAWRNGDHLLVGAQLPVPTDPNDSNRGMWLSVHIGPSPSATDLGNQFFGPDEVLTVTVVEKPRLYFVKMMNGSPSSFSEYAYDPDGIGWMPVNAESWDGDHGGREMPAKDHLERRFAAVHEIAVPGGPTVYSFVDEEGSIVYFRQPYFFLWRYVGYEMFDAKLMPFANGEVHILGRFRGQDGGEALAFPNGGFLSVVPAEPKLWEDGWTALNYRSMTRVMPGRVEMVRFKERDSLRNNVPEYIEIDTSDARLLSAEGALVKYEKDGEVRYLSLFDVLHAEGNDSDSLWARPLEQFTASMKPRPVEWPALRSATIPEPPVGDNANAPVPEPLRRAVDQAHEVIDYSYAYTYRKFDDRWFVLIDRHFYEFKDGVLEKLGEAPVSTAITIGEGFEGYGAADFVRAGDAWIVADTSASRVIKLNDRMEIVAELAVPYPYRLTLEEDRLRIAALSGVTIADSDLNVLETAPQPFASVADVPQTEWEYFREHEIYEDTETGLTWYVLHGRLYQYREAERKLRSFAVGHVLNARAEARILPYRGEEVLLLFDHRLERFRRDGEWLGTISFPRAAPDGIYDTTPPGEGSFIYDEAAGRLYLVQGYRIIEIDLVRGEAKTLFRQDYADLGQLLRHRGNLYLLLHGSQADKYAYVDGGRAAGGTFYTEIVNIDLSTGKTVRSIAEGFYEALEIEDDPGGSGETPAIRLIAYE